jgi:rubrerythrin
MNKQVKSHWLLAFFFASLSFGFVPSAALAQNQEGPPRDAAPPKDAAPTPVGSTKENLQTAYQTENQARTRDLANAAKADEEGFAKAASLFRALAKAEEILAGNFGQLLTASGVTPAAQADSPQLKSTLDNVLSAIQEQSKLRDALYPAFLKKAQEEKNSAAAKAFDNAQKVETEMANLLISPLANPEQWKGGKKKFIVCPKCGYVTGNLSLNACPVSGDARKDFVEVQ